MNTARILHIYGQSCPHDEAYIVGTSAGLLELLHALNRMLAQPASAEDVEVKALVFTADGEGYECHIRLEQEDTIDRDYLLPYTDAPYPQRDGDPRGIP